LVLGQIFPKWRQLCCLRALLGEAVCRQRTGGTGHQYSVAGVGLPIADSMKVLGVTLDRRLIFDDHVSAVARSCNYHARAIRHVRQLLTVDLAQTFACSLILSRIDYCNAVLHGAPSGTIQKLQRVQNNAARLVLQVPRRSHATSLLQ